MCFVAAMSQSDCICEVCGRYDVSVAVGGVCEYCTAPGSADHSERCEIFQWVFIDGQQYDGECTCGADELTLADQG